MKLRSVHIHPKYFAASWSFISIPPLTLVQLSCASSYGDRPVFPRVSCHGIHGSCTCGLALPFSTITLTFVPIATVRMACLFHGCIVLHCKAKTIYPPTPWWAWSELWFISFAMVGVWFHLSAHSLVGTHLSCWQDGLLFLLGGGQGPGADFQLLKDPHSSFPQGNQLPLSEQESTVLPGSAPTTSQLVV